MQTKRRRRLIRYMGWVIGAFASAVAVLLIALAIFLLFFDYTEQLRTTVEAELTRLSGEPATIRSISLDLPRGAFELRGISVRTPDRETPVLELDRIRGNLRLSEVLRLRLQWGELLVDGLTLYLEEGEDAGWSLAGRPSTSTPLGGFSLAADRISVERAVLVVANERVPWELRAANLSLELGRLHGDRYEGRVAYEDGTLQIKDHEDVHASLDADFEVVSRELFVEKARVTSDFGELDLTGKLAFTGGSVHGRFDVEAAGDAARSAEAFFGVEGAPHLAEGQASFRGTLSVEPGDKTLEGTVILPEGRVAGLPFFELHGQVFWDHSLLQVAYAQGTVGGGRAKLQLHQPLPVREHAAALDLDVDGASLARVITSVSGKPSPVDATVSGRASFSLAPPSPGRGRSVEGTIELRGQPPRTENPSTTGLLFHARAKIQGDGVLVDEASFRTRESQAAFSGLYPREGPARLWVDFTSEDLAAADLLQQRLRNLVRNPDEPSPALIGLAGRGEARGEITERLPGLRFDGEVASERLWFESVSVGAIRARATIASDVLSVEDLIARLEGGALAGRGSLHLSGTEAARGFDLDVNLSRWPTVPANFGVSLPLSLQTFVSGRLRAQRGPTPLQGNASLELEGGLLAGEPFDEGRASFRLEGSKIRIEPIFIARRGGSALEGRLELDTLTRATRGLLTTKQFDLAGLGPDWTELGGIVEGKLELTGTLDRPVGSLSGRGRQVRFRGVTFGEAFFSGTLRDDAMDLSVSVEQQASELVIESSTRFEDLFPMTGRMRWHEIDAAPWLFPDRAEGTSFTALSALSDGSARFRLNLRGEHPLAGAELDAELTQLVFESESYRMGTVEPVPLHLRNGTLSLPRMELAEGESHLVVGGNLELANGTLELGADGVMSLGVLESLYPSLETTGETTLSAKITGSFARPEITGYADLDDGSLRLSGFRQALGGLRGRLVFDNRTLRIPELEGVFGSGPITVSGTVALDGFGPGAVDLSMHGSGVRLRYPEGFVATLEGDLSLLGTADARMLSGSLVLQDAIWSREYDLVSGILSDREGLALFDDLRENESLKDLRLDVAIRAPGSLKVRNSLAVVDASAALELGGTISHPVLLGQSEAQDGEIYFLGQRYDITAGKVDFVDPTKVEPFVDLTAETRVRSYRVELRLTGTPDRFYPELSSDPPLRTVDILRLLAGANERELLLGNEEEELAGVGVASLLTERLTQEVGKRAERLFGLDRFSIDPFLVGQFANPTARVSLGKQITRQLSINYSSNLNAATEAIILIEYTPEGPMSWILSRDEEGDVGIDVKFRKSF